MFESKIRVGVAFLIPPANGGIGASTSREWFVKKKELVMSKLTKMFPNFEFNVQDIEKQSDVNEFLMENVESIGFLIFILTGVIDLKPLLYSFKPTIFIGETYNGAGEYLLEYSKALESGMKVTGIISRDIESDEVLKKVKLFEVIYKLNNSKILFITDLSRYKTEITYPVHVDLHSSLRNLQPTTGIVPIILSAREFIRKYYRKVRVEEAKLVADKWVKNAKGNSEDSEEIIKSAKLYIAMKRVAKDYSVDGIALDCIMLYRSGLLDAWPCLGYMELWND